MFYVRIDYQFKTSEPKNAYVGGANSSRVKVLLEWTGNVQFPVRWSLKEALPSGWGGGGSHVLILKHRVWVFVNASCRCRKVNENSWSSSEF